MKYKSPVSKESYEQAPLVTAVITYFGFYLLMLLGFVNQFLFPPVVATEKNRDVSRPNN
jgi:serine palmitoyltransferase